MDQSIILKEKAEQQHAMIILSFVSILPFEWEILVVFQWFFVILVIVRWRWFAVCATRQEKDSSKFSIVKEEIDRPNGSTFRKRIWSAVRTIARPETRIRFLEKSFSRTVPEDFTLLDVDFFIDDWPKLRCQWTIIVANTRKKSRIHFRFH